MAPDDALIERVSDITDRLLRHLEDCGHTGERVHDEHRDAIQFLLGHLAKQSLEIDGLRAQVMRLDKRTVGQTRLG